MCSENKMGWVGYKAFGQVGEIKKKNISNNTVKLKIMLALRYALPYYLPPKDVGQIRILNYRK